jgi:SWI/SNF-related matrix-associated actin-dependent regulator 1 of chromatin subfamily A
LIELYPYQREGVKRIHEFNGRCLLADEMGLGKTIQALQWCHEREAWPLVVICPAAVKYGWESAALATLNIRPCVLEGRKPSSTHGFSRRIPKMVVINYDILHHWRNWLSKLKPTTIVIDELHYCSNRAARRTKAARRLSRKAKYVIGLTGTPLKSRPIELFPGLNMIRPDVFNSYWTYGQQFCAPRKGRYGWEFKGATHKKELNQLLRETCMVRRLKKNVLPDLPDKIRRIVCLDSPDIAQYQKAASEFKNWLYLSKDLETTREAKAGALVKLGYLKRLAAQLKLPGMLDWIHHFFEQAGNPHEKLVIFAYHKKIISSLKQSLPYKSVVVDGGVHGHARRTAIDQFRLDPKTRVFIGQIDAVGTGVNGLQVASTALFAELSWTPSSHSQAEDRLHRIGQQHPAWLYYAVLRGTIEEDLCRLIQHKQETVSSVLDGASMDTDTDIFDQLLKEIVGDGNRRPATRKSRSV